MKKDPNKYPKGWNESRVLSVLRYYDSQTDEEAAREIEKAPIAEDAAWMLIPKPLLPQVRKLVARHKKTA